MEKYVLFKDDDLGKGFSNLKRFVEIIINKKAKSCVGLIGKYIKVNSEMVKYINNLDSNIIEVFCHGYYHSALPFLIQKYWRKNRLIPTEFNKNYSSHKKSLKKYRILESKYLKNKAICFGPPGNIWNFTAINALVEYNFKIMFAWEKAPYKLLTIPLCDNYKQKSFDEFKKTYEKNKNRQIYVLQFHHADLTEEQFNFLPKVIEFLKQEEKRIFINPSELIDLSKKDKKIKKIIEPLN